MKTVRDPVHGDIQLSSEELRVIDTPEFQRLRGIRQLGTSYLVFPGAQHTRFEHSLGTCWLLKRLVAEINARAHQAGLGAVIKRDERRFLALAALIHDITHIPFGHTFEDERRILPPHDKNKARLAYFFDTPGFGGVLRELGERDALFSFFSEPAQRAQFGYELVAGPICADLLDYMKRDAFYCGLHLGYDDRLFRYLCIESERVFFQLYSDRGFRQDAWTELINLLRIRYHLTERVYFHHAKVAAGAMLSRLLEAAIEEGRFQARDLYGLADESFLYLLGERIQGLPEFRALWDAFRARRLYKRVYMIGRDPLGQHDPDPDAMERFQASYHMNRDAARSKLERRLANAIHVPLSAVVIYAPDSNMQLKEADVRVRIDAGPLVSLLDVAHPELDALRDGHRALWRFYVLIDPAYEDRFVKAARWVESELGVPNQLEMLDRGQLNFRF